MRLLGIETSTVRGSVALVEDQRVVCRLEHAEASAHAERILPLVARALEESGWEASAIERIAVGIGPGSFVGLRVGIALAQGLALGLGVPVLGVGSLRSLAAAVPATQPGTRWAMLDARRDEIFVAAYDTDGCELAAPRVVARSEMRALAATFAPDAVVVGEVADTLDLTAGLVWRGERPFPSADRSALIARALDPIGAPALPHYCRGPGAVLPDLPPSPFASSS